MPADSIPPPPPPPLPAAEAGIGAVAWLMSGWFSEVLNETEIEASVSRRGGEAAAVAVAVGSSCLASCKYISSTMGFQRRTLAFMNQFATCKIHSFKTTHKLINKKFRFLCESEINVGELNDVYLPAFTLQRA